MAVSFIRTWDVHDFLDNDNKLILLVLSHMFVIRLI